jgi:hypothetical protein
VVLWGGRSESEIVCLEGEERVVGSSAGGGVSALSDTGGVGKEDGADVSGAVCSGSTIVTRLPSAWSLWTASCVLRDDDEVCLAVVAGESGAFRLFDVDESGPRAPCKRARVRGALGSGVMGFADRALLVAGLTTVVCLEPDASALGMLALVAEDPDDSGSNSDTSVGGSSPAPLFPGSSWPSCGAPTSEASDSICGEVDRPVCSVSTTGALRAG